MIGPFTMYNPPAVYGPVGYPVKKIDGGYYIEGYGAAFQGSCRQIAEQILFNLVYNPEQFEARKSFTGPFHVELKPNVRITLCLTPEPEPTDLDVSVVSDEITKAFEPLAKLIIFS